MTLLCKTLIVTLIIAALYAMMILVVIVFPQPMTYQHRVCGVDKCIMIKERIR